MTMDRLRQLVSSLGRGKWPLVWQGLGALLVGIGLGAVVFPVIANVYTAWQQREARQDLGPREPQPVVRDAPTAELQAPQGFAPARLVIESIGLNVVVREWTGPADLRQGLAHDNRTALPGQRGNCVIVGFRNVYGSPFLRLDEVRKGDEVLLKTPSEAYWYAVDETGVCGPEGLAAALKSDKEALTLVTCDPPSRGDKRLYVKAVRSPKPTVQRSELAARELIARVPEFQAPRHPLEELHGREEQGAEPATDAIAQLAEEAAILGREPPAVSEIPAGETPTAPAAEPAEPLEERATRVRPGTASRASRTVTPRRPAAEPSEGEPAGAREPRTPARPTVSPVTPAQPTAPALPGVKLALPLKRPPKQGLGVEEAEPPEAEGSP